MDPARKSELDGLRGRPKDLIDDVEAIAAKQGSFAAVDENYYTEFVNLSHAQIENLAVAVLLNQEKEVRRLASGNSGAESVERVSRLVRNTVKAISLGLARFDAFARLGLVARIGVEPTAELDEAIARKFDLIDPVLTNTVRKTLPWILSRDITQNELPL